MQIQKQSPLSIIQFFFFGAAILYFGRDIFIPISFAILISFALYPICVRLERIRFINRLSATIISVVMFLIFAGSILILLTKQSLDFLSEWGALQQKLVASIDQLSHYITESLGISPEQQSQWLSRIGDEVVSAIITFLKNAISASAVSTVMVVLVPVYVILILYFRRKWISVLYQFFPPEEKLQVTEIVNLTVDTYYNFIKGMALVYLIVGILNSAGLLILGVPHAILFGFIASVLTFIPYVGIIVGALLPITVAWVTYDSIWMPIGIIGVFTFVQYLEANLIFPFAVSSKLKVNTLAVLISIFTGSILWGVSGMILFVPFVGILKLVADHSKKLKTLAVLLGENEVD